MNERMDERVAQYFSLYPWLFWTIVTRSFLLFPHAKNKLFFRFMYCYLDIMGGKKSSVFPAVKLTSSLTSEYLALALGEGVKVTGERMIYENKD